MVFCLLVFGPRSLSLQSVDPAPQVSSRMPSVPVQALGVSALWLYILDGAMFSRTSLHCPQIKRRPWTGFARSHSSCVLDLIQPIATGQITFLTVRRSLKHMHKAIESRGVWGASPHSAHHLLNTPHHLAMAVQHIS